MEESNSLEDLFQQKIDNAVNEKRREEEDRAKRLAEYNESLRRAVEERAAMRGEYIAKALKKFEDAGMPREWVMSKPLGDDLCSSDDTETFLIIGYVKPPTYHLFPGCALSLRGDVYAFRKPGYSFYSSYTLHRVRNYRNGKDNDRISRLMDKLLSEYISQ